MKVYVYSDDAKRNLVFKTLSTALARNADLNWTILSHPDENDSMQCIAYAHWKHYLITICELEVIE